MIKAVIFDVGGVLQRTHDHRPRRSWEAELGLRVRESEEIVFSSGLGTAAQCGLLSDDELWTQIGRRLKLEGDRLLEFRDDFWSGDVLDTELIALIRRLRPRYQTAIISNATDNLLRVLTDVHDIADAFDLIVCSAEEGIMKPDPAIYERTLSRLGRKPHEAVFIDDSRENVSAAHRVGMHAIHYREGLDVEAALARLGVEAPKTESAHNERVRSEGDKNHA